MITKMPVPMIAPIPKAVRSSAPTARRSFDVSADSIKLSADLVAKGPGWAAAAMAPVYRGAAIANRCRWVEDRRDLDLSGGGNYMRSIRFLGLLLAAAL